MASSGFFFERFAKNSISPKIEKLDFEQKLDFSKWQKLDFQQILLQIMQFYTTNWMKT